MIDPPKDPLDGPPLRWYELLAVPVLAAAAIGVFAYATARFLVREVFRRR